MSQGAPATKVGGAVTGEAMDSTAGASVTLLLLAAVLVLTPAVGYPDEELLQDTLKSMLVALGGLGAALAFFWAQRSADRLIAPDSPRWHNVVWLPLGLMAFALGSMAWSHTYLAAVEAIRWFIFSLLVWLGLNTFTRSNLPLLVSAIHWGAGVASLWAVLQFLLDFSLFGQGPNPASTFVNRNFFAEFVVCTLPFSAWLLATARGQDQIAVRALGLGVNVVALMMTGTRSALLALALLALLLPLIFYRYRVQLGLSDWTRRQWALAAGILLATLVGLGSLPTGNAKIAAEKNGRSAIERTVIRVAALSGKNEFTTGSGSIRMMLWKATGRMILAHPITGVGAGAWEVAVPLYQTDGTVLETDFYAHNEYLQLLAEYGAVGWLFLMGLIGYLCVAARRTWRSGNHIDAPLRAMALLSLLALLAVSGAGFAWRLAGSGMIFAVALAVLAATDLAASDARMLSTGASAPVARWPWALPQSNVFVANVFAANVYVARACVTVTLLCLALAAYISWQAVTCERKIITAVKMALTISASGAPADPRWNQPKAELLKLAQEGIAINPHYRKITPLLGDNLAGWGDWKNAIWVWESVLASRPNVVAILSNVARGKAFLGDSGGAAASLARARAIAPNAPSVHSLEVLLLSQGGQIDPAIALIRQRIRAGSYDVDLLNAAYALGEQTGDWPLAILGMELRNQRRPELAATGWLRIGNIYLLKLNDEARAITAYRAALAAAPEALRDRVRAQVPESVRDRL